MNSIPEQPTNVREVDALLAMILPETEAILHDRLLGIYLHGSLVLGGFDPRRSDIDYLVVTSEPISETEFRALRELHDQISASGSPLATELEASYLPAAALRRHNPENAIYPVIERGGRLEMARHFSDWVIQLRVLRHHGLTLLGPDPFTLIDPIAAEELRRAVLDVLNSWWAAMLENPDRLEKEGYRAYAVHTMCRILYTLDKGIVVAKPVAAQWVLDELDERWTPIVKAASDWPAEAANVDLEDTLELIRYVVENASELPADGAEKPFAVDGMSKLNRSGT